MIVRQVEQVMGGWLVTVELPGYYAGGKGRVVTVQIAAAGMPMAPSPERLAAAVQNTLVMTQWVRSQLRRALPPVPEEGAGGG